jgi:Na+-translocating ferredoxin:NAD+ oxidoreductase subunit D
MQNNLIVTSSPHIKDDITTRGIMLDVIIALLPAVAAGVYFFKARALLVVLVTVFTCVASEYIIRLIMKKEQSIGDLSAVVTGILLALNLPPSVPIPIAVVGGIIAIVIVKQLFGGLGHNFMNPVLGARVILVLSWTGHMTGWIAPGPDAISTATPLGMLKEGIVPANELPGYMELFIGNIGGCIGETSALALLIGALYLIIKRVITLEIPLTFIGSLALITWIFGGIDVFSGDVLYHILSGGLIIGAFFMATDYSTSPVTFKGRLIMGVGCGILTAVIRVFGNYPEGVSFAIIIMNITVPLIDRYTVPKSFGGEKAIG